MLFLKEKQEYEQRNLQMVEGKQEIDNLSTDTRGTSPNTAERTISTSKIPYYNVHGQLKNGFDL